MDTYTCYVTGDDRMGYDLLIEGTKIRVATFLSSMEANCAKMLCGRVKAPNPRFALAAMSTVLDRCGILTVN